MRRTAVALLAAVAVLAHPRPTPAAPLDLLPKEAGLVVAVEQPRRLIETALKIPAYRTSIRAIPGVREVLDSTAARRLFQFVAYAEKELGASWPELLDKLAGDGIAIGAKVGTEPAPSLIAIRGTEEKAVADAFRLLLKVVEEEMAREGGTAAVGGLKRTEYHGVEVLQGGDDLHVARVGRAILVGNKQHMLEAGVDLALGRNEGESVADRDGPKAALALLGGKPEAWLWADLVEPKKAQQTQDFFANTRKDLFQTLVFGGTADAVRRADFVSVGLFLSDDEIALRLRLPAKRADFPPELAVHVPTADRPGSLPLLEPPGVALSQSFYLDLGTLWSDRKTAINEQQLKDIENGAKQVSRFLPGGSLGKLFEQSGPYHRVVVTGRGGNPYAVEPNQPIPPVALVSSMRDPEFGKSMTSVLRGAALLAGFQIGLELSEQTHDGVTIISYRFPESGAYPVADGDPEKLRFNFVPSFAVVGDSFAVASRPELIRDLIPELKKPTDPAQASPAVWRAKAYADGLAELLRASPEPTVTNAILSDGVGLEAAKKQVDDLADWVRTLGRIGLSLEHGPDAFQVQLVWRMK